MTNETVPVETPNRDYFLSGKIYNALKFFTQIVLPAFGTLYFTLASIWGLPAAEQIMATTLALGVFLGVVLRISSKTYSNSDSQYDGTMLVSMREDGVRVYSLELNKDTEALDTKTNVNFKVDTSAVV